MVGTPSFFIGKEVKMKENLNGSRRPKHSLSGWTGTLEPRLRPSRGSQLKDESELSKPLPDIKRAAQEPMVRAVLSGKSVTFSPDDTQPDPRRRHAYFGASRTDADNTRDRDLGRSLRFLDEVRW